METKLTVDKAGRVVLPKPVRDRLQLMPGDSLTIENSGEAIVLRPVRAIATMRKRDGIWVFNTGSPISTASVDHAIRELREDREGMSSHPEGSRQEGRRKPKAKSR